MCFGPKCTSVSCRRRRCSPRQPSPTPTPLAVLDLSKPEERNAHDFVQRMSTGPNTSWKVLALCRQASVLLCVVRWLHPKTEPKPFSLVEVSLVERAVYWHSYATASAAHAELARRCEATATQTVIHA